MKSSVVRKEIHEYVDQADQRFFGISAQYGSGRKGNTRPKRTAFETRNDKKGRTVRTSNSRRKYH